MLLSLPAKFALGTSFFSCLIVLLLGAVSFQVSREGLVAAHGNALRIQAASAAAEGARLLTSLDEHLAETAAKLATGDILSDPGRVEAGVLLSLNSFGGSLPVKAELHDRNGRILLAAGAPPLIQPGDSRLTTSLAGRQRHVWIDDSVLTLMAPVADAQGGPARGVLVYQVALQAVNSRLGLTDRALDAWFATGGGERRPFPGAVQPSGNETRDRIRQEVSAGLPPAFPYPTLAVAASMPQALAEAALSRLATWHLLSAAGVLGVVVPLSLILARRLVRRLGALEQAMRSVMDTGRTDLRTAVTGGDEVARLFTTFNGMMERLVQDQAREVARHGARYRRVLSATKEGYLRVEARSLKVTEVNEAFLDLSGHRAEAVLGHPVPAFLRALVDEALAMAKPGGLVRDVDAMRADGRRLVMLVKVGLDMDEEGTGTLVLFLSDITQRRIAEEALDFKLRELERSNNDLQQFAYAASHDLQEPLRMVNAYLKLLDKRLKGLVDESGREFIQYARDGAQRMSVLIQDLLAYSRVQTRKAEDGPVDCGVALAEALKNLEFRIAEEGAEITVAPLPVIRGDYGQMVRLFQNLVGNAVKFRLPDRPPRVEVWAVRRDTQWLIAVRDNGIGIAAEDHERIFNAFSRLHSRGEYDGTGLGLALVKRIVERHHGTIWVDSRPGEGTTLRFTLPAALEAVT